MFDWNTYSQKTKDHNPRPILVEAVSLCTYKSNALDLGAGALNESRYLVSQGFTVIAVDSSPSTAEMAEGLDVRTVSMEEFEYPRDSFDLVAALYALPFVPKDHIPMVVQKIQESLHPEGIFVGQFFGKRDWRSKECSTHTEEEVREVLSNMHILKFFEQESDMPTADGIIKHNHVFHVIAKNNLS